MSSLPMPSLLIKAKIAYSAWLAIFNDFPKIHRQTLGKKIDDYFLKLLETIFTSLYLPSEQKITKLAVAIGQLDGIKFFLQLAWENKCLSPQKYSALSEQLKEIGRMLGGWKKGLANKTPALEREKQ